MLNAVLWEANWHSSYHLDVQLIWACKVHHRKQCKAAYMTYPMTYQQDLPEIAQLVFPESYLCHHLEHAAGMCMCGAMGTGRQHTCPPGCRSCA